MSRNIFITGVTSGLGEEFMKQYLDKGFKVYACSRSDISMEHDNLFFTKIDLLDLNNIHKKLFKLNMGNIDLAILNAGIMDGIKTIFESSLNDIYKVMDINTFSNKVILDFFIKNKIPLKQVVAISSGSGIKGRKGLGSYSLSKATLNMLIQLYAAELPNTHLVAVGPGIINTKIVKKMLSEPDSQEFKVIKHTRDSNRFNVKEGVSNIIANTNSFLSYTSGEYLDIRNHLRDLHTSH